MGGTSNPPPKAPAARKAARVPKPKKHQVKDAKIDSAVVAQKAATLLSVPQRGSKRTKKQNKPNSLALRNLRQPAVRKVSPLHHSAFDLRKRSVAKALAVRMLSMYAKHSPVARRELSLLKKGLSTASLAGNGAVALTSFENLDEEMGESHAQTSSLDNGHYNDSAATEIDAMSSHPHRDRKLAREVGTHIQQEMVHDELESNAVGTLYLQSLLDPCGATNPGVPDEENRALSMKLRVRTVYLLPMTNDEAYIRVTRNPARHVIIDDGGGAAEYEGPLLMCNALSTTSALRQWDDEAGKMVLDTYSFAAANDTAEAYVRLLESAEGDEFQNISDPSDKYDYEKFIAPAAGASGPAIYAMLPCAVGDSFKVRAWTSDTSTLNYRVFARFAVVTGGVNSVQYVESAQITGSGVTGTYSIGNVLTAPAGAVGVVSYGVVNQGAVGTTTIKPAMQGVLVLGSGPSVYPFGSSDMQDLQLLLDYADDIRTVGCRVTLTYVAKKLEGGYVVGGQLPQTGDEVFPDGSLSQLAVIPGMKPRPLNGVTPGISFPLLPMSKEGADYHPITDLFSQDDFGEGAIQVVTTGADANLIILQTELSLQARSERQTLMQTTGEVDLKALSQVQSYLGRIGPLAFVTGNDEHEAVSREAEAEYRRTHPTFSFFNGWFSNNDVDADINLSPF